MRSVKLAVILLAAMAGLSSGVSARAQGAGDLPREFGVWRNPKNSVHVELKGCGDRACGYVVWANPDALADARKGGTQNLIGLQLLRDFAPTKSGNWRGKVYVPDLNMTFSGTAELIDARTLRAKGCVFANVLCKSQIWTRVDSASG